VEPSSGQDTSREPLRILIATPAPPGSRTGNRQTAGRWAALLADLGHAPTIVEELRGQPCDLLIALHATRSAPSIARYRERAPRGPLIVAGTGTDLYVDLPAGDPRVLRSLGTADRIVVLHPLALDQLPDASRPRARVIVQSARLPPEIAPPQDAPEARDQTDPEEAPPEGGPGGRKVRVVVAAHLREVKDPLRAGLAAAILPEDSAIEVVHLGGVLDAGYEERAERLAAETPRYRWIGEVDHADTLRTIAASHALVISSRAEGAPNVLSEAIALGTPVIATDIPGCTGLLGPSHPALFPPGDTEALARLLRRLESDETFRRELEERSRRLAELVRPERERQAWSRLLAEMGLGH
jgi:putative glycosyltransferase (TIGR04348 family)